MITAIVVACAAAIWLASIMVPLRRPKRWAKAADRLARRYDILLTRDIEVRIARMLRRQHVVVQSVYPVTYTLYFLGLHSTIEHGQHFAAVYVAMSAVSPVFVVAVGAAMAIPSWNAQGARGMTHVVRPRLPQVFTRLERSTLAGGIVVALAATVAGLVRYSSGAWWLGCAAAYALAAALWWVAVSAIRRRPARASTALELGWDDVVRHQQIRDLTVMAVFLPAGVQCLALSTVLLNGNLVAVYVLIAVAVALSGVFRRGNTLWRQSWTTPGPGLQTSTGSRS